MNSKNKGEILEALHECCFPFEEIRQSLGFDENIDVFDTLAMLHLIDLR